MRVISHIGRFNAVLIKADNGVYYHFSWRSGANCMYGSYGEYKTVIDPLTGEETEDRQILGYDHG